MTDTALVEREGETRIADIFCPITGAWLPTLVSGPPVPRERLSDGAMYLPHEERERLRRQHSDETLAYVEAAAAAAAAARDHRERLVSLAVRFGRVPGGEALQMTDEQLEAVVGATEEQLGPNALRLRNKAATS